MSDAALFSIFGIVGVVLVGILIAAAIAENQACEDRGGHMVSKTTTGVGPAIGGSGGVAVTVGSVQFCISDDGRILE